MRIYANKDSVNIVSPESATTGAYNAVDCKFSLESELTECGKIMAIFSPQNGGTTVESDITSTLSCKFPPFDDSCRVAVGIYAYDVNGDTLTLRYSPSPAYVSVVKGSYADGAEHPVAPDANTYALLLNAISLCELASTAESRIKLLNSSSEVAVETLATGVYRLIGAKVLVYISEETDIHVWLTDGLLVVKQGVANSENQWEWFFSGKTLETPSSSAFRIMSGAVMAGSTTTYPTIYDFLSTFDDLADDVAKCELLSNKFRSTDTPPSDGFTDNQYWSAKVADAAIGALASNLQPQINGKISKDSIAQEINDTSSENDVPSAKAVYTSEQTIKTAIEGDLDSVAALIGGAS